MDFLESVPWARQVIVLRKLGGPRDMYTEHAALINSSRFKLWEACSPPIKISRKEK